MDAVIFSKNDKLSKQWVDGYADGYNNRQQTSKDQNYENGYRRGLSDGIQDLRISLSPKQPSIFST